MGVGDIGYELNLVGAIVALHHRHKVEPYLCGYGVEFYIVVCCLYEIGDFLARESLGRRCERPLVASLDLHKVVVTLGSEGHYVNLVGWGAPVALHNKVVVVAQILHCRPLALGAYA